MAEEQVAPELGDGELDDTVLDSNIEDLSEDKEEPQYTQTEQEEMKKGWTPKDQYEGDPDDWVSAERFRKTGALISKMEKLERQVEEKNTDFEERLENSNMFLREQTKMLRVELNKQKKEAIKEGDVDEVGKIDAQLETIPAEKTASKPSKKENEAALIDWKVDNEWCGDESSAKFKFANNLFKQCGYRKMSQKDSLAYIDDKIKEKFPDKSSVNPRRNEPGLGDSGGKGVKGKVSRSVPKSQWTYEERQVAESMEGNFTDKEINQMVADSRSREE